jgi:cell division septation protein DedD
MVGDCTTNELKPKLILTKPNRSGTRRFRSLLTILIAFILGVFIGMKIKGTNIHFVENKEANISNSETAVQGNEKKPAKEYEPSITISATKLLESPEESKSLNQPNVEINKYTIQVAAFEEIERAQRVANELKEKGYNAYIVPIYNSRGEAWNLIKVGKFKTKEEARDFASLFQKKENMEAIVEELKGY